MGFEDDLATLSLSIDATDSVPLYQQLATQLRQLIGSGRISTGERLPSSRRLAQLLAISRTSTLNAYDQLIAEGLLVTRPALGIYVTALGASAIAERTELRDCDLGNSSESASGPIDIGLSAQAFSANADVSLFPFREWSRTLAKVWRRPDPALLQGQHPGGYGPLRQAVARYIKAVRGIDCHPAQVIITAGSRDALMLISKVLLSPGDPVALENPCYPSLRHGFAAQGVGIHATAIDSEGMRLPPAGMKLAWMTPARQYPLGTTLSLERRLDWLGYSRSQQCWLVEDDYDSEFHYRKAPLTPLFNLASQLQPRDKQSVILVGSFSKLLFKTLRIGYLIVPQPLIPAFLDAQDSLGNLASVPIQPALAEFLAHRRFASHLRRMRQCYQQRRNFLHTLLQHRLSRWFDSELPSCGMHLLAHCKAVPLGVNDLWFEQQLARQGIYAPALSPNYSVDAEQGLLLGFSGASEEALAKGVEQIERMMKQLS